VTVNKLESQFYAGEKSSEESHLIASVLDTQLIDKGGEMENPESQKPSIADSHHETVHPEDRIFEYEPQVDYKSETPEDRLKTL
jgi:hypothetical protein